jgi:GTP diphosphokinase / guanosine-3',5'-bis(diphosphate) 3'-diphosphatase
MRKQDLPLQRLMSKDTLSTVAADLRYSDIPALYAAVGEGQLSAQTVVERVVHSLGGAEGTTEDARRGPTPGRSPPAQPGRPRRGGQRHHRRVGALARCCTPVPGDDIVGFVTRGNGVSVHRRRLHQHRLRSPTARTPRRRRVDLPAPQSMFLVAIQVDALDRNRLLADITQVLSDQHVNILSANVTTNRDRVAKSRFTFEMGDPKHLDHVLKAVRTVDGVFDVFRVAHT